MKSIVQDFILRQHGILPVPAYFRYGRRSINQKLWELSPELLKLINDDNFTSTETEIRSQFLCQELCKWLAYRCVYNTPEEPPIEPLDISVAVASAIATVESPLQRLMIESSTQADQENGDSTVLVKGKR